MPGEPVKIGPFIGGLNTFSDNQAVDDNELIECLNFEPDFDGSLRSRPPVKEIGTPMPLGATGNATILGTYYAAGNTPYIIASDGLSSTYYFNGSTWTLITSTFAASNMTQFNDRAWLLSPVGETDPGGYWTVGGGFVADANMPRGDIMVANKLRLWVGLGANATINGTRVYYSKVLGTTPFWPVAPDFVDIGGGDGQNIVQMVVYYQSILLFRSSSIYSLSYSTDPANAVVSMTIPGIGLTNKHCLVPFESYLYFMYQGRAYEFVNARAQQLNDKVTFEEESRTDIAAPYAVSLFNGRIMFQWWDTTYVFYLNTRSWTRWRSTAHRAFGDWTERLLTGLYPDAMCFSALAVPAGAGRVAKNLLIQDGFDATGEVYTCQLQTKNYNYEASTVWKKLFWWAIDAAFNGTITGTVTAVNFTSNMTWGQARQLTWGQLRLRTWGSLSSDSYTVKETRTSVGVGPQRKTAKMPKALRFKQLFYTVSVEVDGTSNTSPARVGSLMTYVRAKQTVSKTIS